MMSQSEPSNWTADCRQDRELPSRAANSSDKLMAVAILLVVILLPLLLILVQLTSSVASALQLVQVTNSAKLLAAPNATLPSGNTNQIPRKEPTDLRNNQIRLITSANRDPATSQPDNGKHLVSNGGPTWEACRQIRSELYQRLRHGLICHLCCRSQSRRNNKGIAAKKAGLLLVQAFSSQFNGHETAMKDRDADKIGPKFNAWLSDCFEPIGTCHRELLSWRHWRLRRRHANRRANLEAKLGDKRSMYESDMINAVSLTATEAAVVVTCNVTIVKGTRRRAATDNSLEILCSLRECANGARRSAAAAKIDTTLNWSRTEASEWQSGAGRSGVVLRRRLEAANAQDEPNSLSASDDDNENRIICRRLDVDADSCLSSRECLDGVNQQKRDVRWLRKRLHSHYHYLISLNSNNLSSSWLLLFLRLLLEPGSSKWKLEQESKVATTVNHQGTEEESRGLRALPRFRRRSDDDQRRFSWGVLGGPSEELANGQLIELLAQFYAHTRILNEQVEASIERILSKSLLSYNEDKSQGDQHKEANEDKNQESQSKQQKQEHQEGPVVGPLFKPASRAALRGTLKMLLGANEDGLMRWLSARRAEFDSLKNVSFELVQERPNKTINICADGPKILILPNISDVAYCYTHDQWIERLWSGLRFSGFHYPIIVLNVLIFLFGTLGNIFVCLSVKRNHQLRSVTNYFIVNLAFADFLVILICLPATVVWDLSLTWFFDTIPCKLIMFLQDVSISVSVLTLTAISIDRYYAICHPLRFKTNLGQAKRMIALIWLVSLLIMMPDLIYLRAKRSEDLTEAGLNTVLYSDCNYNWSTNASRAFQFVKTILLYLIPFLLMFCAHYRILQVLRLASSMMADTSGNGHHGHVANATNAPNAPNLSNTADDPAMPTLAPIVVCNGASGQRPSLEQTGELKVTPRSLLRSVSEPVPEDSLNGMPRPNSTDGVDLIVARRRHSHQYKGHHHGHHHHHHQHHHLHRAKHHRHKCREHHHQRRRHNRARCHCYCRNASADTRTSQDNNQQCQKLCRPPCVTSISNEPSETSSTSNSGACLTVISLSLCELCQSRDGKTPSSGCRFSTIETRCSLTKPINRRLSNSNLSSSNKNAEQSRQVRFGKTTTCDKPDATSGAAPEELSADCDQHCEQRHKRTPNMRSKEAGGNGRPKSREPKSEEYLRRQTMLQELLSERDSSSGSNSSADSNRMRSILKEGCDNLTDLKWPASSSGQTTNQRSPLRLISGCLARARPRIMHDLKLAVSQNRRRRGQSVEQIYKLDPIGTEHEQTEQSLDIEKQTNITTLEALSPSSPPLPVQPLQTDKKSSLVRQLDTRTTLAGVTSRATTTLTATAGPTSSKIPIPMTTFDADNTANVFILTMHNKSKLESRRKAAKMLTAIVVLFGICYLPVHLINFLRQFIEDIPQTDVTSSISMLAHCVCYLNSAINPIIYNHMNSVFRAEFKKFLSCLDWRQSSRQTSSSNANKPMLTAPPPQPPLLSFGPNGANNSAYPKANANSNNGHANHYPKRAH